MERSTILGLTNKTTQIQGQVKTSQDFRCLGNLNLDVEGCRLSDFYCGEREKPEDSKSLVVKKNEMIFFRGMVADV